MQQDLIIQAVAFARRELLRIVEPARQLARIEDDRGGGYRPGEGAASSFVDPRHRPKPPRAQISLGTEIGLSHAALFQGATRQAGLFFAEGEIAEPRIEARQAAAAIEQLLRAAGPGRMSCRIDVEVEGVP